MPDRLLTVAEAGELLGTGERFVRRLIAERRIRYIKLGRPVRVPESAIAEFIEARTVEPRHRTRPLVGPRPRPGSRYGRAA
ncbi:helix-turn-helix domain-containing protein [Streptomyces sp. NPDC056716]|uniref:helix-turn-helix domain-containing protein n=1 Tax=unclassified Streptomyces TaxID=2593676 RepID=UPI0036CD467B